MRRVNVCAIKLKSVYASIVEAVERGEEVQVGAQEIGNCEKRF